MIVRQSDLKTWARCPLQWRYQNIDLIPREQSASLSYGSIIHQAVLDLETSRDLTSAIAWFLQAWDDPGAVDPEYKIDYYVRGTNWKKYQEQGVKTLKDWWALIQWDADTVLGREFSFDVPIGKNGNRLAGTIDKLVIRYRGDIDRHVILVSDYKTNSKVPTYQWLEDDLQFTAYCYATTRPEFWASLPNGPALFQQYADSPRYGEWVSLMANKRMDAGTRDLAQYNRLAYAVDAMADSVAMRIFVPNISGETCRYCDFRAQCGLRTILD